MVALVYAAIIYILLLYAKQFLVAIGIEEEIAYYAWEFVVYMLPGFIASIFADSLKFFMLA